MEGRSTRKVFAGCILLFLRVEWGFCVSFTPDNIGRIFVRVFACLADSFIVRFP